MSYKSLIPSIRRILRVERKIISNIKQKTIISLIRTSTGWHHKKKIINDAIKRLTITIKRRVFSFLPIQFKLQVNHNLLYKLQLNLDLKITKLLLKRRKSNNFVLTCHKLFPIINHSMTLTTIRIFSQIQMNNLCFYSIVKVLQISSDLKSPKKFMSSSQFKISSINCNTWIRVP